jgi:hypothetical protein
MRYFSTTAKATLLPLILALAPTAVAQTPKFDVLRIRQQYFCPESKPCVVVFRDTRTIRILPPTELVIAYRIEVTTRVDGTNSRKTFFVARADLRFALFGDSAALVEVPQPATFFDIPLEPETEIVNVVVTALGAIGEPSRQDDQK